MTEIAGTDHPEWLMTMPKVELHVHLEGTIGPATLWQLSLEHGVDLGVSTEEDVAGLFIYDDFTGFIDTFTRCSSCLKTARDLGKAVDAYGAELARQNVRYAEVHYNPEPHFRRSGIGFLEALESMNAARERVRKSHGIELRWIADGVRDANPGPISALHTVEWMIEHGPETGIVALGLGGNEIGRPPHDFTVPFQMAREAGYHVVAHAGEATGPDAIWDTLETLHAERIGHGIAAACDQRLLDHLARLGIPLEVSPTSNLRTGVIDSIDDLPLRAFAEAGVQFSINTDDPPMFGTDLVSEYAHAARLLELDRVGVARLVASTIDQSFADAETKARLQRELHEHTPFV